MKTNLKLKLKILVFIALISLSTIFCVFAKAEETDGSKVDSDLKNEKVPLKTDTESVEREQEEMSPERLTAKQQEEFRAKAASHQYQAEVSQLMNIIINSLYSNSDVFLRELISNASDALDKIRILSLTEPELLSAKKELDIKIKVDKKNRLIHIIDSGVGMTKEELIKNLGTIAKSGTKDFASKLKDAKADAASLIGQFGVGFYSAFLVADKVTVASKHNESDKQYVWESAAGQSYVVSEDPRGNTLGRGTQITLHVKEAHSDLLEEEKIEKLIKRYSEFIDFPIYLYKTTLKREDVPLTPEEIEKARAEKRAEREKEKKEKNEEELGKEEGKDEEEIDVPTTKEVTRHVGEWEQINTNKPIWTRPKKQVTKEEYNAFYKAITKDSEEPATYTHFNAEGNVNFKSILYIPKSPPKNMFELNFKRDGLKLYVRRVFITDDFFDVLPAYLAFLKGVVDSEDMELNVSREILQQSKTLNVLKKKIVRKALSMMQGLTKNETEYLSFYRNYDKAIKYGILQDQSNQVRLSKLLRFPSSHNKSADAMTSLADYVERMRPNQKKIYYLAGDDINKLSVSPLAESTLEKGYEILYLTDPLDEYSLEALRNYDAKHQFANLQKEDQDHMPDEKDEKEKEAKELEKKKQEALDEQYKDLKDFLKESLKDRVSKVQLSQKLTKSPAAVVAASYGVSANMERILKAQSLADKQYKQSPIFEVNPNHPLIVELNNKIAIDGKDNKEAKEIAELLFETASLVSGYSVEKPVDFASRIHTLLGQKLGVEIKSDDIPKESDSKKSEEPEEPIEIDREL